MVILSIFYLDSIKKGDKCNKGRYVVEKTKSGDPLMKMLLLALLVTTSAFATEGFICNDFNYSDIQSVDISIHHGDVFVKEIAPDGSSKLHHSSQNMRDEFSVNLSDWNGYTRELVYEDGTFSLTTRDECSQNYDEVICIIK